MSDSQAAIKHWLEDQLARRGRGAKTALANALGHASSDKITRMLPGAKEPRRIQIEEIAKMARHFDCLPPGYERQIQWLAIREREELTQEDEEEFVDLLRQADPEVQAAVRTILKKGTADGGS